MNKKNTLFNLYLFYLILIKNVNEIPYYAWEIITLSMLPKIPMIFLVRSVYLSLSGRNAYKHNRCIHWHGNAYYFFFGNIFNYEYDFCVM